MSNNIKQITIGADPELFFHNNEEFIPACDYINGSKSQPFFIDEKGSAVLNDNVMAEFNIIPAKTSDEFVANINHVLSYFEHVCSSNNIKYVITPSASFSRQLMDAYKERFMEFGCEPDECIYGEEPQVTLNSNIRMAGGHVHLGYDTEKYPNIERRIVETLDYLLSIPFVILDNDNLRRKFYGKAGRFRLKNYGLEYRSLSNYWLSSEHMMKFVFEQAELAIELVISNKDSVFEDDNVREIINTSNIEEAHRICAKYKIKIPIYEYENETREIKQ